MYMYTYKYIHNTHRPIAKKIKNLINAFGLMATMPSWKTGYLDSSSVSGASVLGTFGGITTSLGAPIFS